MGPCCSGTTMDTMNYRPDWLIQQSLLYRLIIAHTMNSNPDTKCGTQNKNFGAQSCRQTQTHGSILLVTIPSPPPPPNNAQDKSSPSGLGVGTVWRDPVPGVGGGANEKIPSLWLRGLHSGWGTPRLHIFKEKKQTFQNLYLKVCFKIWNECAYDEYSNGLYFLERKDRNISSA